MKLANEFSTILTWLCCGLATAFCSCAQNPHSLSLSLGASHWLPLCPPMALSWFLLTLCQLCSGPALDSLTHPPQWIAAAYKWYAGLQTAVTQSSLGRFQWSIAQFVGKNNMNILHCCQQDPSRMPSSWLAPYLSAAIDVWWEPVRLGFFNLFGTKSHDA